jgi:hypothetical protein
MPASHLPTYVVKILTDALLDDAYLAVAGESDIAEISLVPGFKCDWMALWSNADFDCEALVKLTYQGKIQGIVKFALYPYPLRRGSDCRSSRFVVDLVRSQDLLGSWL